MTAGDGKGDDRDDGPDAPEGEPRGVTGVDVQPMPALDREQVEALRKERDELRDQLLRKRAEFENYRKRVERDREQSAIDATASVLKAVIPTIDNLDRALEATGAENTLRQGVELTRRELLAPARAPGRDHRGSPGPAFRPPASSGPLPRGGAGPRRTGRSWRCSARAMPSRTASSVPRWSRWPRGTTARAKAGRTRYTDGSLSEAMIG